MGCGPGGSYLYRLLRERRPEVVADLFDEPWHGNRCGIKPCAWVVSFREFSALCSHAEIYPGQYITGRSAQVIVNNIKINADIALIDKPSLIGQLMGGDKAGGAGELRRSPLEGRQHAEGATAERRDRRTAVAVEDDAGLVVLVYLLDDLQVLRVRHGGPPITSTPRAASPPPPEAAP